MTRGVRSGLGSRSFRHLLAAWAVSSVGDGVLSAALPLVTAVITRDPLAMSAVALATVLPWLLVALPAGAIVDRLPVRRTLVVSHLFRSAVTLSLAVVIATGAPAVPVLVVGGFLLGSAETFTDSASQSLLVSLAGPSELERANGRVVSVETTGVEIAGPLAAATLFAWEPALCFAAVGVALAVAALLAFAVRDVQPAVAERTSLRSEVVAGLRFLVKQPALRTVVGVVGVTALLTSGVNAVAFLYAIEVVRLPAASVPTLLVCTAIGTLLAAPVASRWAARWGSGAVMISALLVLAAGIALLGSVAVPLLIWVAYFVMGVGAGAWNVLSAANRQRLTPRPLTGRVTSAHRVLAWGLMPLGAGLAGPIAEVTSLQAVILGAAVVLIAVVAVAAPRLRRLPGAEEAGETSGSSG